MKTPIRKEYNLKFSTKTVKVLVGNSIIDYRWSFLDHTKRYIVITDTNLSKIYSDLLNTIPNIITIITIKPGEKAKCLKVYEKILSVLTKLNIRRDDYIIAFGGGVIGDLTTFIASTYLRGTNLINIPTSLISQIDSSIGGKCGINFYHKNNVGTFYNPDMIIVDTNLLKTLPTNEFYNGMAEMIKYGIIKDRDLFTELELANVNIKYSGLTEIIDSCLQIKMRICLKDEFDLHERHILNFGHTYGHVIETKSNYKISHGEAIAIGMYYEVEDSSIRSNIRSLLEKYHLASNIDKWNINYNEYLKYDKKSSYRSITKVYIEKIGKAKLIEEKIHE